ncbi:hypothetical protein [Yoonia sp. BS5-3]|uniref:Uncharacterized protein n=1 Tax=Yoonia phaeophyticola TaxID=3137369 RepID=A0ABZ2UZJ3_9RHOB
MSLLQDETVISMNASTLLESKFGFRSKYYVLSDARFISAPEKRAWATSDLSPNTHRVVRSDLRPIDDETLETRTTYVAPLTRDGFSLNLSRGYYFGCTTTMLALQLAWHLGAKDVYLLGCDLRYPEENPRFYAETTPQLEDAFTSVQLSNIVNAAKVFESQNRQLINCSARSFLRPYLPYMSFADAVSDKVKKSPRKRRATVQKKIAVHS